MQRIIKKDIGYNNLGGSVCYIDEDDYMDAETLTQRAIFLREPICLEFMNRRDGFTDRFSQKIYVAELENGDEFLIAEDELEECKNESDD